MTWLKKKEFLEDPETGIKSEKELMKLVRMGRVKQRRSGRVKIYCKEDGAAFSAADARRSFFQAQKSKGGNIMRHQWIKESKKSDGRTHYSADGFSIYERKGERGLAFYIRYTDSNSKRQFCSLEKAVGHPVKDRKAAVNSAYQFIYGRSREIEEHKVVFNGGGYERAPHPKSVQKKKAKKKKGNGKRKNFMKEEWEKGIWKKLREDPPMEDMATLMLGSALRENNIFILEDKEIDLKADEIYVPPEKHKQEHGGVYSLSAKAKEMLEKRLKEKAEKFPDFPYVFWRLESGKPKQIRHRWCQRKWRQAMNELGIEDLNFYDLRRTCLSRAAAKGATKIQLLALSNHSSIQALEHYLSNDAIRPSARKFL